MIESIECKNFKALRNVACPLAPFTVIAGPNACGKTSLLQCLEIISKLSQQRAKAVFSGEHDPATIISHGSNKLDLTVRINDSLKKRDRALKVTIKTSGSRDDEDVQWRFTERHLEQRLWKVIKIRLLPAYRRLLNTAFLRLNPDDIGKASLKELPKDTFTDTGYGLPTHLAGLAATAPKEYAALVEAVKKVIPCFESIAFNNVKLSATRRIYDDREDYYRDVEVKRPGFSISLDTVTARGLSARHVSEGTLLVLGLLAKLYSVDQPRIVLLDNLESALHPKALGELVRQIRTIMERHPGLQVIATTHSPYLLDHFEPEEIRLMCSDKDGFAVIGSLTDHPDFDRWKDEMLPGEFWSMVGEDWLLKKQKKTVKKTAKKKVAKKKSPKNK